MAAHTLVPPAERVEKALRRGDAARAIRIASRYARLRPRDPNAWLLWSRAVEAQVDVERTLEAVETPLPQGTLAPAEEVLREGLRKIPGDRSVMLAVAQICLRRLDVEGILDKADEAREVFRQLHTQYPEWPDATLGLAELAHRRQDWEEFDRLVADVADRVSATETPELLERLVTVLAFAPNSRRLARDLLARALKVDPNNAAYRVLLGLLWEQDDPEASARELNAARGLGNPEYFDAKVDSWRRLLRRWGPE